MKRPDTIALSYMTIALVPVANVHPTQEYGQFDSEKHTIELRAGQHPAEEANTILHEVMHAIAHTYALPLNHDLEEAVVTKMANGLCEFMTRNPAMMRYLLGRPGSK